MGSKFTGRSWVGNLYQKFEAICHEVDDVVSQDTVRYVENQVQTVGENVKKFCSNFMQDLLPAAVVPAKHGLSVSVSSDDNHHLRNGVMLEIGNEECPSNSGSEDGEECLSNANSQHLVWKVNANGAEHEECPSNANVKQLSLEVNAADSLDLSECHVEECPPNGNMEQLSLEVNAADSIGNYPSCKPDLSQCHVEECPLNANMEQLSLEVKAADSLKNYPSCTPCLSECHVEECPSNANVEQLSLELNAADSVINYPSCTPCLSDCHVEECPANANVEQLASEVNTADSVKNYPSCKPHLSECHLEECPANANVEQLPLEVAAADSVIDYPSSKQQLDECLFEDVLRILPYKELRSLSADLSLLLDEGSLVNNSSDVYTEANGHEDRESSSDFLGLTYPGEEDPGEASSSNGSSDENQENVDSFLIRILPPIPLNSVSESPQKWKKLRDSFADSVSDISSVLRGSQSTIFPESSESGLLHRGQTSSSDSTVTEFHKNSGSSPANFPQKEEDEIRHILAYANGPNCSFDTAVPSAGAVLAVSDISSALPVSQLTISRKSYESNLSDMGWTSSCDFLSPESCGVPESSPANFLQKEGYKLCYNLAYSNDPISSFDTAVPSSGAALPILSCTSKSQNCGSSTPNLFIRFTGQPDDFCNNVEDFTMENLQLMEKIKLGQCCVPLETNVNHAISRRIRKLSSYKKKIRYALASRKRIEKEYKQLAIWYGDFDTDFNQPTEQNVMPASNTNHAVLKNSPSTVAIDSEWELV